MASVEALHIHQELLLLALRDDRGTPEWGVWAAQAVGGGALADLLLSGRIALEGKKRIVASVEHRPLGDPVLDDCLARIGAARRRASAQTWVGRFATDRLFHAAAGRLCELGVLRIESRSVLLILSRRVYPEVEPAPEREIVERLRDAIFSDGAGVEARTVVLLSLAAATDLLRVHFAGKDLARRKARIEELRAGEAVGQATAAVVQAVQAAVFVAAIMPAVTASS